MLDECGEEHDCISDLFDGRCLFQFCEVLDFQGLFLDRFDALEEFIFEFFFEFADVSALVGVLEDEGDDAFVGFAVLLVEDVEHEIVFIPDGLEEVFAERAFDDFDGVLRVCGLGFFCEEFGGAFEVEVEVFADPRIDGTLAPDAVAGLPL